MDKRRILGLVGLGGSRGASDRERKLKERLENKDRKLEANRRRLEDAREHLDKKDREIQALRARSVENGDAAGVKPEKIVWIFCTGRSGSTWLASMMSDVEGYAMWNEPLVGKLFGEFYYERAAHKGGAGILGRPHIGIALKSIRSLVLEGAAARHPQVSGAGGFVVIKEPHGSVGAPLLMEALPESRMVFLVRDPRDAVASALAGQKKGSWTSETRRWKHEERPLSVADTDPDAFVRLRARIYLRDITKSKEAYDSHGGPKARVRYEDMRADPLSILRSVYEALDLPAGEGELARVAEKHAWESIPEEERGEDKFYRKATPGGWREDLTPDQARTVERVTAPLLDEFYPGWREGEGGR